MKMYYYKQCHVHAYWCHCNAAVHHMEAQSRTFKKNAFSCCSGFKRVVCSPYCRHQKEGLRGKPGTQFFRPPFTCSKHHYQQNFTAFKCDYNQFLMGINSVHNITKYYKQPKESQKLHLKK